MKIQTYQFPHSSFLSVEKDMDIIVSTMMKNDRFKKLLYYTVPDALDKPNLTSEQSVGLFGKQIKIVPKLQIDGEVLNYIIISFDNFTPNGTNPEFRDNIISFDIICHFDQWNLRDFQLRPYKIAAELDTMFNGHRLTGIGKLEFVSGEHLIIDDEFSGFTVTYQAIHGEEDKKKTLNPEDNKDIIENFDTIFNNK